MLTIRRTLLAVAALALTLPAPGRAQLSNTWTVPRGLLRLSFSPWYTSYDHRYAADGTLQDLGADISGDSLSAAVFPTMGPAIAVLRGITGDTTLDMRLGKFQNKLDADIRRFPLAAQFGLTDRLSISVNVPIVTVRMNDRLLIDSTAQVGLNPVVGAGADTAIARVQALIAQITAAADAVDANIKANQYGCPSSAQCDQARSLVNRARTVQSQVGILMGVGGPVIAGSSAYPPPFAPLASSPAGTALAAAIQSLAAQLTAFGAPAITATLPLPTARADTGAVQSVLVTDAYGYSADSLTMRRRTKLGDVEVGLHYGLIQSAHARAVLTGILRLPTGNLASPASYTELSTGDHQTDIEGRLDLALEPGDALGLWLSASYTAQMADELSLRVAAPHTTFALASTERTVQRKLGNMASVSFGPLLRLSDEVRVFGSASYFWKGDDQYSDSPLVDLLPPAAAATVLNQETGMTTWSFGGGIAYRATRSRTAEQLPIEAGLSYASVYSGSGGFTPASTTLSLYLRLFYRVFGAAPAPAAPATPPAKPGN